jgi:hypothetical protein
MGRFTFLKVKGRSMAEDASEVSKDQIVVKIDSDLKDLIPGYLQNRRNDIVNTRWRLRQRVSNSSKGRGIR